jgi:chromosome segregation ATPase
MMAKKTLNQLRGDLTRLSMRIDQLSTNYSIRLDRLKKDKEMLEDLKASIQDLKDERKELKEAIEDMEAESWQ